MFHQFNIKAPFSRDFITLEKIKEGEMTMSDNDSVKRGDVRHELKRFIACNKALIDEWVAKHIDIVVSIVPPVSHEELSAKELLLIEERLFQDDEAFRYYVDLLWHKKMDEAIAYAQKWAKEHPEEEEEKQDND